MNDKYHPIENWHSVPQYVRDAFDRRQISRATHYTKFGFHRPILSAGDDRDRFIVKGKKVFHWGGGNSFMNFLESHLLQELGTPFRQDFGHPLNVWWQAMRTQADARQHLGPERGLMSTVAALSFFTVAYDLFVIADNTELRDRLLKSLRVADQFHGARYELMIAACLIRAGFKFTFSNEENFNSRHCDGYAVHSRTGRNYAIEMKTKGRTGILGKPGTSPPSGTMKGNVSRQLREALSKPADTERLIFIDMNLPPSPHWQGDGVWWQRDAVTSKRSVEEQPGHLPHNLSGFVIFTNIPSNHLPPTDFYVGLENVFTGYNQPNFATDLPLLGDAHPDIADLFDAFRNHDVIPQTFE